MTAIAINRFHARYRLGAGTRGQQDRLQRILAGVLDSGLGAAVQRSGIDTSGELCIREVNALVRLSTGDSDSTLAAKLALAIADAIESGSGKAHAGVVHYGSRAHALIDLAVAAVGGDFTRSWAWQRLGLWNAESIVSTPAAVRLVLGALAANPRDATAAIMQLARNQTLFDRLLQYGSPPQLLAVARGMGEALGAHAEALHPPAEWLSGMLAADVDIDTARRLARRSVIAGAAARSRRTEWAADVRRDALAVFSICEVEPALLHAPNAGAWVCMVAQGLLDIAGLSAAARHRFAADGQPLRGDLHLGPARAPALQDTGPQRSDGISNSPVVRGEHSVTRAASHKRSTSDPSIPVAGRTDSKQHAKVLESGSHPLPDVRRRAHTRFGGLLFFVHLAGRVELAKQILQDPKLAARSPRWCLHQLAMALAPVSASDPAALAFAGLLPETEPPCTDQPAPTEAEMAAVAELRAALLSALRDSLDRSAEADSTLADFICRRTAEIVADPGWLEARFSLEDVDTGIRAAGLDLDPGWVPWLGLVIKFVYA